MSKQSYVKISEARFLELVESDKSSHDCDCSPMSNSVYGYLQDLLGADKDSGIILPIPKLKEDAERLRAEIERVKAIVQPIFPDGFDRADCERMKEDSELGALVRQMKPCTSLSVDVDREWSIDPFGLNAVVKYPNPKDALKAALGEPK